MNDQINRAAGEDTDKQETAESAAPVEFLVRCSSECERLGDAIDSMKSRPLQMRHRCNQELFASATDVYTASSLALVNWAKGLAEIHFQIRMTKWQVAIVSYYAFGTLSPPKDEVVWLNAMNTFMTRFGHFDCEE